MTTQMSTPLILTAPGRKPFNQIATGDPVTVNLYGGKRTTGIVTRIAHGNYWVKLAALAVPEGYYIGQVLPLTAAHIIDWG